MAERAIDIAFAAGPAQIRHAAGKTILIAGHDQILCEQIAERCRQLHFDAHIADTAIDALWQCTQLKFDMIVIDIERTDSDYVEVAEKLLNDDRHSEVPVIAVTQLSDPGFHRRLEALNITYCHKGVALWTELGGLIRRQLNDEAASPIAAEVPAANPTPTESNEARSPWPELAENEPATSAKRQDDGPPKVLVVDDDRQLTGALRIRLDALGYRTFTASNAQAAKRIATAESPRAIISDYEMPGTTGQALILSLKNSRATRDIPVIMITGFKVEGHTDFALKREMLGRCEAQAYLEKPFEFDDLARELQRIAPLPRGSQRAAG